VTTNQQEKKKEGQKRKGMITVGIIKGFKILRVPRAKKIYGCLDLQNVQRD
jgi:hypothetical protein